jgi:hypothetical protein
VWEELQAAMDQLLETRLEERGVLSGGGESDHRAACCTW